jgi:hypothetical protein
MMIAIPRKTDIDDQFLRAVGGAIMMDQAMLVVGHPAAPVPATLRRAATEAVDLPFGPESDQWAQAINEALKGFRERQSG